MSTKETPTERNRQRQGWKDLTAKQQKFLGQFHVSDIHRQLQHGKLGWQPEQLTLFGFCVTP